MGQIIDKIASACSGDEHHKKNKNGLQMDYSEATVSKAGLVRKEVTPRRDLNEKDPDMQVSG